MSTQKKTAKKDVIIMNMMLTDGSKHVVTGDNMLEVLSSSERICKERGLNFKNKQHLVSWERSQNNEK